MQSRGNFGSFQVKFAKPLMEGRNQSSVNNYVQKGFQSLKE